MTSLGQRTTALLVSLALAQGQAHAQSAVSAVRAGCFALTDTAGGWVTWYADSAATRDIIPRNAIIQLTSEREDAPYEVYRARVAQPLTRFRAAWQPIAADSVRIDFSDGLVGVSFSFAVRGDSLHGFAEPISDVVMLGGLPPRQEPRRGARLPCPPEFNMP